MIKIKGVILMISCHKHITDRVNRFLPGIKEVDGWKIHVVIGNPFINEEYLKFDKLLILKCEDSYIYLIKKLILSFKILYKIYDIEEGIFRIGDDMEMNNNNMENFLLREKKEDYMGVKCWDTPLNGSNYNDFMFRYYKERIHEMTDPMGGISNLKLSGYLVPKCTWIQGGNVYTSNKSNKILINHLDDIKYNIFYKDETYGYPFTIEDMGVGFILQLNGIKATFREDFHSNEKNENSLGWHTDLNR